MRKVIQATWGGPGSGTIGKKRTGRVVECKEIEVGFRNISAFVVGVSTVVRTAFHCSWISNSPVRWQGGRRLLSHQFQSMCVCDVAGGLRCRWLHKGNSPECVLRT